MYRPRVPGAAYLLGVLLVGGSLAALSMLVAADAAASGPAVTHGEGGDR